MIVGYVQNHPIFGEKMRNFQQIESLLEGVKADLLVLPELFATGYSFRSKSEAKELGENNHGQTSKFLKKLSVTTGATLIAGFIEEDSGKIYNSSLIVSDGQVIDTYRKVHLFYKENSYFNPGDEGFKVYDIKGVKIGVIICFDWLFPEACRTLALQGAQVIAHPSNLVMPYCQDAMVTRCLENKVFSITANRVGVETRSDDTFSFTGQSQITSPKGEILKRGSESSIEIFMSEINEKAALDKSINSYNNLLTDRRKDLYFKSDMFR